MPLIHAGGLRHYYRADGNDDRPATLFAHSLGCDHTQRDPRYPDCNLTSMCCGTASVATAPRMCRRVTTVLSRSLRTRSPY